jgi:hypothetical protein
MLCYVYYVYVMFVMLCCYVKLRYVMSCHVMLYYRTSNLVSTVSFVVPHYKIFVMFHSLI